MSTRSLVTSNGTPLGLRVRGGALAVLVVLAEPRRTRMAVELHGPDQVLSQVTAELHADIWVLDAPGPADPAEPCIAVAWVPEGTELNALLTGGQVVTWGTLVRRR